MSTGNENDDMTDRGSLDADRALPDRPGGSDGASPTRVERTGLMPWAWRTVLVLTSGALLSTMVVIASMDLLEVDTPTPKALPGEPPPCDRIPENDLERLAERRWRQFLARLRREPLPETSQALEEHLDTAFAPVYARIPGFLDWHYSITGQYTELALAGVNQLQDSELARAALDRLAESEFAQEVTDLLRGWEFTETVLDRLQPAVDRLQKALDQLQQGVDSRLLAELSDRIQLVSEDVESVMKHEMRSLIAQRIHDEVQTLPAHAHVQTSTPCPAGETAGLRMAYERTLEAAIPHTIRRFTDSAVPTGIVAVTAGVRGALAGRALVKGLSRRLLARLAGRTASARGSAAAAGAAAGAVFGPVGAAVGGLAAGSAAWLLADIAVLAVDEHFNRDDLQHELTALVDEQKAAIRAAVSRAVDEAKSVALDDVTPFELGNLD